MILRKYLIFLTTLTCIYAQYNLILDRKFSPPHSVPANPLDMYYTVPVNQTMSKPIIAYIVYRNGSVVTDELISNAVFTIQSLDRFTSFNPRFKDYWAVAGGKLCQSAVWWEDYPTRMDRSRAQTRCGTGPNSTTLTVQAFKGRIIVDWLFHSFRAHPRRSRIIRFTHEGYKIKTDTNAFRISAAADDIRVTTQPPRDVIANHDFSIVAEILDNKGHRLTTGLDSSAFVELTVPYYYKTFYRTENKEMLLKTTSIRLAGANAINHQSNNDFICRKRASAGVVSFDKVRILDAISDLKLNITMTMARDPWYRIPNCENCYSDTKEYNLNADGTEISFRPSLSYKHIKPLTFTEVFRVSEQVLNTLRFSNFTLQSWKSWTNSYNKKIPLTRNVLLPGEMLLEAIDANGEIIYSGRDSSFRLNYETIPRNVCISSDATSEFSGGKTYIYLSICEIVSDVQIIISPSHNPNISITTPNFEVGGKINIAHFGDFQYSGDGAQIESHVNSFIRFAAYDVNKGLHAKALATSGIRLSVDSFDTKSDIDQAFKEFAYLIREDQAPADKCNVIISSSTDEITRNLNPELVKIHLPYISVSNTADVYSNNNVYPYFNRVCWAESSITASVLQAMKERLWTKLILVRDEDAIIGSTFRRLSNEMDIDIKDEVIIPDFSREIQYLSGDLMLEREMKLIRSFGSKIIVLFADAKNQPYILRAAYLAELDSVHGYQWVLMSKYTWQFPFLNPGVCSRGPLPCTAAFKGTVLFSETYNVTGYHTEDWIRVLGYFFSADKYDLLGGRVKYRSPKVGAKMALGYDAVVLFAQALLRIISQKKSLTGVAIAQEIRRVNIKGLTNIVSLNEHGDRKGYLGFVAQVWPESTKVYLPMSEVFVPIRLLYKVNNLQLEIPYVMTPKRNINNGFYTVTGMKYNTRSFFSTSGWLNAANQSLIRRVGEPWPFQTMFRKEKIIPPYYCIRDCGFKVVSVDNVNLYDTGECVVGSECMCFPGYTGSKCTIILCACRYGTCTSPKSCKCHPGWNGTNCDMAICYRCEHGTCIAPDLCQCNSTLWTGTYCQIHIASILVPVIIMSILFIVFLVFFVRNIIKRLRRNAALATLDWIVEWSDVTHALTSDTNISRTNKSLVSMGTSAIDTYTWKNESWYVKFFNNRTMDMKDEELCLEMVQLTKIRNRNLIVYVGACLTSPNVGLFMEVAPKGSLNDLLLNDSIELGWDFRYNFMKDICLGMKYLHEKKDFGSHGRLKSHNCLVDSRWTIRISGFGAPTMRYGKYRNESADEEKTSELLWTAPELLRVSKCLDDVKNGTPAGDTYSFAIVVTEIVTRTEPFNYELGYISVSSLLDLILGNNYPGLKETRRTWEDIGGADMLTTRPILNNEFMPEKATVRVRFKKMLEDAWHENPFSRPTFETLLSQLNIIHPSTGELIDNLINLLESYSNNLEMIVVERTNELEANKARAEELLSQMLPPNVTSELKRGRKVLPVSFECATVFFSDIVDFSRICQQSSPLQIVALLNETYNVFDEVLDEYDVYKVETISDSYMVVSGVPVENENRHAGEICTMALDLMSTVTTFQIPHRPKATLQLRIGIHSGPVVSGVVGLLMPRYCLFGDTVNTASRMMSSSHALCIQTSDKTAEILDELGGYELECRGERQVKGRGMMTTYWLWGKDTFRKRLPDQSLAIPLSQHKFK